MKRAFAVLLIIFAISSVIPTQAATQTADDFDNGLFMGQLLAYSSIVGAAYSHASEDGFTSTDPAALAKIVSIYSVMTIVAEELEELDPPPPFVESHGLFLEAVKLVADTADLCRVALMEMNASLIGVCGEIIAESSSLIEQATAALPTAEELVAG